MPNSSKPIATRVRRTLVAGLIGGMICGCGVNSPAARPTPELFFFDADTEGSEAEQTALQSATPPKVAAPSPAKQQISPDHQAKLKQRDALSERVKSLQAKGKFVEAAEALGQIMAIEREVLGEESADVADSYGWLAEVQEAAENFAAAETSRQKALDILTKHYGNDHYRVTDAQWSLTTTRQIDRLDPAGRSALARAGELDRLVQERYRKGQYSDAVPAAQESLKIVKDTLGEEHPRYASILNMLAVLHEKLGDFAGSEKLFQQSLEIKKKTQGENHPDYPIGLNNLAQLYMERGNYAQAKPLFQQALEIKKKILGAESSSYGTALNNLAVLYEKLGDYDAAETLLQEAVAIKKAMVGEDDPDYAASLSNLAWLYFNRMEFSRAEPILVKTLAITKKAVGEEHADYALQLNNLAALYRAMGMYSRGVPLSRQALGITKQLLGEQHRAYASSLLNLAGFYEAMGDCAYAEPLFQQALAITKITLGEDHPAYASCLIGLAGLSYSMSDFDRAESLYRKALDIQKRVLGDGHPDYAETLRMLASTYQALDDFVRAEPLQEQALAIQKKVLGEKHPLYARSLNNLADIYRHQGDYARAEPLYRQALAIAQKALGDDHPDLEIHLADLAILYQLMGKTTQAEPLFNQALTITKNTAGQEHPNYVTDLNNLAQLYVQTGDYARAEPLAREALDLLRQRNEKTLPGLSEAQALVMLGGDLGPDLWLSIARNLPNTDPLRSWSQAWRHRGLISALERQRHLAAVATPEAAPLVAEIRGTQQQLAQLMLAAPQPNQRAAQQKRLGELNEQKESLEKRLAAVSADFRHGQQLDAAGPDELLDRLPAGTVVVDLAFVWDYRRETKSGQPDQVHTERHYEAFVARGRQKPAGVADADDKSDAGVAWVHLGPAAPIDEAAIAWRESILQRDPPSSEEDAPEVMLRRLVWAPLEEHFGDSRTIIVIPDGTLTVFPWCALPGRKPGSFVLDDYEVTTASHGRHLIQLLDEHPAYQDNLLLVGGVDYDHRPTDVSPSPARENPPSPPFPGSEPVGTPALDRAHQGRWKFLPGSKAETQQVAALWKHPATATPLSDVGAGKSAIRVAAPRARHLHLATHGFFADPLYHSMFEHWSAAERLYGGFSPQQRGNVAIRSPLLLTGIVLAGANLSPAKDDLGLPTGDDGILTAEEVVNLDLRGTELVVLSACETGLGKIGGGGEGVFGLQRAFHLAGSRNVIGTLWRVSDAATMHLMTEFYKNLWERNLSPAAALRRAQLKMLIAYDPETARLRDDVDFNENDETTLTRARLEQLSDPEYAVLPPYYWSAFSFSGDWR